MKHKTFEQVIAEQGKLIYTNVGDSMYPLILPRDLLVIEAVKKPLKQYDIPLYKRDSGQYVLHRIVDIRDDGYVMRGDNRIDLEYGVEDRQILGVLTHIIRDGKTLTLDEVMTRNLMKTAFDLVYLVRCSLMGEAPSAERCAEMRLPEVYRLAMEHSLGAIAAFALEKTIELPRPFNQAKTKAIRRQAFFDIERGKILRALGEAGVWCVPLKGVWLKDMYPKSAMREMSDNDILCDCDKMQAVKEVMERLGYKCERYEHLYRNQHDVYSKPPTLEFEMHRSLFAQEDYPVLWDYYTAFADKLKRGGGGFSEEDRYIYLIAHAFKHYDRAGTGLRTLADLYVFIGSKGDSLDRSYINAELEKLQLTQFESGISLLAQKLFDGSPMTDEERDELVFYVRSGSAGLYETFDYNLMLKELGGDSPEAKRKYLLRRMFISGTALKKHYPFFYRHRALYPLLAVYRPFKGLLHLRKTIGEYRKIKGFKTKKK